MQVLRAIIGKEFLALGRDIHGLLVLFIMPAIFILTMSLALKDYYSASVQRHLNYTVVDADASGVAAKLAAALKNQGYRYLPLARLPRAALLEALRTGRLNFALLIDKGDAAGHGAQHPEVTLLVDPGINPSAEVAFRASVVQTIAATRWETLLRVLSLAAPRAAPDLDTLGGPFDQAGIAVQYVAQPAGGRPSSVQQSVPAWLVFAMFFVVIPISTIFIREREMGTLTRLSTMQVSPRDILLGKLVPYFVVNQVQAAAMLLVGLYLVPQLGGDALVLGPSLTGLWLISAATSVAAIGFALLIASLARTTEQGTTFGGVANIILATLGGIMVPKFAMPDIMQSISNYSPMAWGLNGFLTVLVRQGGIAEVMPNAIGLLLFGALSLALCGLLYRRQLR